MYFLITLVTGGGMRDHHKLRAFQIADEIALSSYRLTRFFPREELHGLTSQIRRAAVSVPANIVEGCARHSLPECIRFMEIAYSSLRELHYHLDLAHRLGFLEPTIAATAAGKCTEAEKVLASFIRYLRSTTAKPPSPKSSTPLTPQPPKPLNP
jgi:four helix bundle protein